MLQELDRILISSSRPGFEKKIERFRSTMSRAARLADDGSKEHQQVVDILRNVVERGDKAVAEYTAKFDYHGLVEALKDAEKLQHHNSKLIKIIKRTENKLSAIAKKIANEVKQIEK